MKYTTCLTSLIFLANAALGQHQAVFPGLSGSVLLDSLVAAYRLVAFPNQAVNRDTLFGAVDNPNDTLTCVYTGYKIWLDPNKDPTQDAFDQGINTEHTYPKSLGADGFAEGDMHHLYAAREDVNNDRGNLPFGEIPDHETVNWYYLDQEIFSVPATNIDLYSERKIGLFEPPEAHKGNVARAMMYFYTMYKQAADAADPTYFEAQRETFCAWHFLDPVDAAEWDRTWKIAQYQEGKPNPFVLDCSLPERSFCQDFGEECVLGSTSEAGSEPLLSFIAIAPNPIGQGADIAFRSKRGGLFLLEIFDLHGTRLDAVELGHQNAGEHVFYWEKKPGIPSGMALFKLSLMAGKNRAISIKKAAVLNR